VADAAGVQLIHDANIVQLSADPDRLLQVITNLLSNAVKFSPEGATVSVTLREGSSGVTLSVIDQGRGIPADKLDSILTASSRWMLRIPGRRAAVDLAWRSAGRLCSSMAGAFGRNGIRFVGRLSA
jgi:light-regulated signal transduction histidine kinase (bacteriophytochrome)